MAYQPNKIEKKWQRIWQRAKIYQTPDKVKGKKNFYHLVMLPYTSGNLHIGHWYNFGPADIYARFKRMFTPLDSKHLTGFTPHRTKGSGAGKGCNVLSPIGFDAFGLPAENAAIKQNINPRVWTNNNINKMRQQLKSIGAVYDWSREIITCEPDYYKWTQWLFLQLYKAGLAYRAKVPANWCPSCKTILANEQVVEGKCERCHAGVFQKELGQWLFKITAFAEDLLHGLENIDWPEKTKIMQKNWIGRTEGINISYEIKGTNKKLIVFTTRPETNFGATFVVLAPDCQFVQENIDLFPHKKEAQKYIEKSKTKTELERLAEARKKTGVFTGLYASNNLNNLEMPIYLSDFVLGTVGTGAVVGVPGHDLRDFEFAKEMGIDIKRVVVGPDGDKTPITKKEQVQEKEGVMINSGFLNGLGIDQAFLKMKDYLEEKGWGKRTVIYKLRDWIISRQRYWGAPIPMIFCQKCDWQPVKEKDLPVLLPALKDFKPTTKGRSPLARSENFIKTKCPFCQGPAQRETDTMDTFVCSSWYFLRYTDPKNRKQFASPQKIKDWLPVNMYIGGAEHSVMHLLYARFFTKALKKLGYLEFSEPFERLRHQGIILGPDGQKMSKSRGNVIDPDKQVVKYGADCVRLYLCFMGPYEQGGPWNPKGIIGISRFLQRVWNLSTKNPKSKIQNPNVQNSQLKKLLHKTTKKVTEDIENFRFNTAISALMVLVNKLQKQEQLSISNYQVLLKLLAPFAPHLSEELWQKYILQVPSSKFQVPSSIHKQPWPEYDPELVKEELITLIIQVKGKVRDKIMAEAEITRDEAQSLALTREKVQKYLNGKKIEKIIFVPGKLINFVV